MTDKSLPSLLGFIDWMSSKGLMQRNTAAGRKAACSKVLGVLDPEEQDDVTQVNLDEAMARFHNLEGRNYVPASLAVYRSRVGAAIDDFKRHLADPASFKPGVSQRRQTPSQGKKHVKKEPQQTATRASSSPAESNPGSGHSPVNVFPIAIRPDVVVRIQGLPFDLTETEARKIANVVLALATVVPE